MKGSLNLGKILGIEVKIHFTFILIFVYVGYISYDTYHGFSRMGHDFIFLSCVFFCVLLHEYGHALAARRLGIQTRQILVLPIGGMAQLESMPEKPKDELFITICGPLVNLGLVVILSLVAWFFGSLNDIFDERIVDSNLLLLMIWSNMGLFIFNLIPAYPMDGGRIFRALLALRFNYLSSTRIAARVGQFIAIIGFALFAYFNMHGKFSLLVLLRLIILCVFIIGLAEMEYRMVKHKYGKSRRNNMMRDSVGSLSISNSIDEAVNELSRNNNRNLPVMFHNEVAGQITSELPLDYINMNMNSQGYHTSHSYQFNRADSLGHALKMMEILGIPVLSLNGNITPHGLNGEKQFYLLRKG